MEQIQKWFDFIAGVSREDKAREELARVIFSSTQDTESLLTPACWRRKSRVTG
ncbi:MAG: hypothetical protein WCA83_11085 [Azonexus sp.]